jgi:hypothetical protein
MKKEITLEEAKYIVWVDYGYEGWKPTGYLTLKEAILHERYSSDAVITKGLVNWDAEVKD